MRKPSPAAVSTAYLERRGFGKVGGEVIFKKDRSGDVGSWAYADVPPSRREIPQDFTYSPKNRKPLAKVLRSTLAALGHCLSAYNTFARLKSARISPDGSIGGRGYIQKIADCRKQYMNCVEALSALSDTLHDEINAPHWSVLSRQEDAEDQDQVRALIQDSEHIRQDPEQWAKDDMQKEFGSSPEEFGPSAEETDENSFAEEHPWMNPAAFGKTATDRRIQRMCAIHRVASAWMDKFPGGLADQKNPDDFDPYELSKGVQVEMEHTDDPSQATEIAMDHLTEDPHYYEKLEIVEGKKA